ncbi:MAG: type I-C CRISPR-associated protein Cas7/Csd2 [Acidaminococcaceae bacterium]|nr:type I-C CRISPR-associated protein Cas7/Csd2 [Acidaminococcaceae bacterium]
MLNNKYDFVAIVSASNANPNGDPLNGNRPRETSDGYGEISDVAIKRKLRNVLQGMGEKIFVQSDDKTDDGYRSLSDRAKKEISAGKKLSNEEYAAVACEKYIDVRSFGQVFAFKKSADNPEVSVGVRGPVSVHPAFSVDPIEIEDIQITKSVNSEPSEKKSSDTMGMKYRTKFGLYIVKGSINPQLAEKTGFSDADAEKIHKALINLFENDSSAARPEGSMIVEKVYWFKHNSKLGQYPTVKVHRAIKVKLHEGVEAPKSVEDYLIDYEELPGLEVNIYAI